MVFFLSVQSTQWLWSFVQIHSLIFCWCLRVILLNLLSSDSGTVIHHCKKKKKKVCVYEYYFSFTVTCICIQVVLTESPSATELVRDSAKLPRLHWSPFLLAFNTTCSTIQTDLGTGLGLLNDLINRGFVSILSNITSGVYAVIYDFVLKYWAVLRGE